MLPIRATCSQFGAGFTPLSCIGISNSSLSVVSFASLTAVGLCRNQEKSCLGVAQVVILAFLLVWQIPLGREPDLKFI